jgi:phosphonoacetaldehyde hydrolase
VRGGPCTDEEIDALYADFLPRQLRCIEQYSDVIPGVPETIERCRQRGLEIGSSTGYTAEIMEVVMARARAQGFSPDTMLCASDIAEGRPAPWLIFENARRLGVYPMAAIAKLDDTVSVLLLLGEIQVDTAKAADFPVRVLEVELAE